MNIKCDGVLGTNVTEILDCGASILEITVIKAILTLVIGYPLIIFLTAQISRLFDRVELDETVEMFIQKVAKVTMWILLLITVSGTLGVDVSAILAGLGIAGLALAFAAQDTLSNVVGGVFIMIDRPFKVGDRIKLPTKIGSQYSSWGDVKEIGLRTTIVRSTDGVIVTIPNKSLIGGPIVNFSHDRDAALRVRLRLGLTPVWSNVQKAEDVVNEIVKTHPDINQEKPKPPQAVLRDFGDQDVVMEIRFYVKEPRKMRPTKSDVVKEVLRRFEEEKISLAFPVRVNMNADVDIKDLGF